ncbi:FYVE, RhoGEF and PH domain-containing protein 6-like [Lampris incognitus]|uniref:FYVE, RhoGEF and PH domain-containing protein 6-like n=1 Tax=Lampris incognitus TaxID=2546036 RepID=UPI0024B53D69|nr:FYVE, RhoGEF and PH domain-containing protein 6-like [Lampris incognitus]
MNSVMQKPPLAPKPKLVHPQRPGLSPATPRRDGLPHPSPCTSKRVKPALAPKPCLHKHTVESKPFASKSPHQISASEKSDIPRTVGLLNSNNGVQIVNKKPDWDYIIPICLCSQEKCQCLGSTTDKALDKDLQMLHKGKTEDFREAVARSKSKLDSNGEKLDNAKGPKFNGNALLNVSLQPAYTNAHPLYHKCSLEVKVQTEALHKNLITDLVTPNNVVTAKPWVSHRTWSDEVNGNTSPSNDVGQELASPVSSAPSHNSNKVSVALRKPLPVPLPRKPRKEPLPRQEKVEEEDDQRLRRDGWEIGINEVKVLSGSRTIPSLSGHKDFPEQNGPVGVNDLILPLPPAPPPRKKLFLSAHERPPALASHTVPHAMDQEEEEVLQWDAGTYGMECSVDEEDEKVGNKEERYDNREEVHCGLTHFPPATSRPDQLELNCHSDFTAATGSSFVEDSSVKVVLSKPQRHSAPLAWAPKMEPTVEAEEGKLPENNKKLDLALKETAIKDLFLTPDERVGRSINPSLMSSSSTKPICSNSGKPRSKSFTTIDLIRSDRQKRNTFRKLLDLKLSVKMFPKLTVKGGQTPDHTVAEIEQCVDGDQSGDCSLQQRLGLKVPAGRKFSCPQIGLEQNVDGDEFFPDMEYENDPHYEEILDYMNLPVGGAAVQSPSAWQNSMYDDEDENIYEVPEPYVSLDKNTRLQQKHTGTESASPFDTTPRQHDRGSAEEARARLDDGTLVDDVIMDHSSDEEDDRSSTSSKGEPQQPEVERGPKKSKIHYIATEIMMSENVFVGVLKLLHIDFRDEVSKASHLTGKPVIEERILNQILYYLPQLYELNRDLLRELEQRVASWDENAQLADIFVKKGPYLKMYSTYIREYDRNVALLEEQSKRNPVFGGVVREFEASPRCANLALRHYLLKPVQRIPQYQLLLTDYLKNLPQDSVDYKDTQAALAIVKEVANHANDIMKQGDNFQKLIQVQCSLNGHHEIVQPGRVFLKEGVLMKLSRKVMQPRMFFLFNDTLLYTTPVQSGQYKLNNMLSLAGMRVSKPNQEAYQNELNIESVERSFILSASSATERDCWLEAISLAISDYTRKKITFIAGKTPEETELTGGDSGAPLGSKAPIWIPDPRATMCMICTCEFTLTWRRHHCRACGRVVCQSCSSNKQCLEYLKNQLARVCDQCFLVLQQQKSEQVLSTALSPGNRSAFAFSRKQKKIPAALKEVSANTDNSSMSGYLQRSKGNKKQWKRLWFVIKDKVLYTYAASEDVAALESQPLLGFMLKGESSQRLQFKLYHKNTLYYIFRADDIQTAQRWVDSFKEATVL